ncbi:MAG: site-specific DNA-methyltransferase, partial [Bacteroidetes bacterium]|nr:site-specific DNA-methyltransferase [Bacteroidota bacterium]
IDEPRKEKQSNDEFDFDVRGRQRGGWTNKLIWGDNKLILSSLRGGPLRREIEETGGLKMIYIDPPFDVGADFSLDIEVGEETFHKEANVLEQIAYRDTWGRGADSFVSMIYERLILMRDLLHAEGCIWVHCDWRVSGYMRLALDEVFGKDAFLSEIIWQRSKPKSFTPTGKVHDTIFWYQRSEAFVPRTVWIPISDEHLKAMYKNEDEGGRFAWVTLDAPGAGEARSFGGKPIPPPRGRHWAWSQEKIDAEWKKGNIKIGERGGAVYQKRYVDKTEGQVVSSLWIDEEVRIGIMANSKESTGYPTQKPESLLSRIIKASTSEGDLVADFFCGSGTLGSVADQLQRKWICADLGKFGIHTARKRFIENQRELRKTDKPYRAFEVLNLGKYQRHAYIDVPHKLTGKAKEKALATKEKEFRELILKAYKTQPLPNDEFFHGKIGNRVVVVGPVNLPVTRLFVEEVINQCRQRGITRCDLLAFEYELGLFPAALEEAKQKGIDLVTKTIPPDVFDKRAVDAGEVEFHEVSYIEATPRFDKKDPHKVAVELTDFSVFHQQGQAKKAAEELREGKSMVVCEKGKLVKVTKDKDGRIEKEVLTKKWHDWIDYWAVDFDYESRKEIIKRTKGFGTKGEQDVFIPEPGSLVEYEEVWSGNYIFENEWQSFRTKKDRELELTSAWHTYTKPGKHIIAVKVVDIFGNDTMTLVPINVS